MTFEDYPTKEVFTHVQNNVLRWGLKDHQMSIETQTRGGYLSWLTVAYDIVCSSSNDLEFPDLTEEQEQQLDQLHSLKRTRDGEDRRVHDDTGWPITRNKLERFVDGEKSRSTGLHKRQTPEIWVRCVIRDFLQEVGRLPEYFDEPGLESFFPALVLRDYFSTNPPRPTDLQVLDFSGTYIESKKEDGENRPRRLSFHLAPQERFYEVEESVSYEGKSSPKVITSLGWATLPPFGGMMVFLQDQDKDEQTHRLYFLHSYVCKQKSHLELRLLSYQGQESAMIQPDTSMTKAETKSVGFLKDLPKSFDKVTVSVKRLKKRTPRGEAAPKLEYDEIRELKESKMVGENVDIEFQHAVCAGDVQQVESLIDLVEDINRRIGGSGGTILHVIADEQLKDIFRIVRKRQDLNYLVKDNNGRLPSQLAMNSDEDVGLGTYLKRKEIQQARRDEIDYQRFAMGPASKPTPDTLS